MHLPTPPVRPVAEDARAGAVLDAFRRIVQVLRESSRAAEQELGVTGAQLFVLTTLRDGGALSINELAARTRTHQSTVSVVVKRLVEAELVRRQTSDVDARRVELSLTPRGRALLTRAPMAAQERLVAAVEGLPARERATLAKTLERIVSTMAASEGAPPMFFEDGAGRASAGKGRRRGA